MDIAPAGTCHQSEFCNSAWTSLATNTYAYFASTYAYFAILLFRACKAVKLHTHTTGIVNAKQCHLHRNADAQNTLRPRLC